MSKWIRFVEADNQGRKTKLFAVIANKGNVWIGDIKWYGAWRCYCFFPVHGSLFEEDCLRDIADFCETQTAAHRQNKRPAPNETEGVLLS
jgi:hypothetical protein